MTDLRGDATAALDAMLAGDHAATTRALDHLAETHGPTGLAEALVIWCDAALTHIPRGDERTTLHWVEHGTRRTTTNPTNVRAAEQWAGRLLAARAAKDLAMFAALAQAVPPSAVGEHVSAMVQMAARIIQAAA